MPASRGGTLHPVVGRIEASVHPIHHYAVFIINELNGWNAGLINVPAQYTVDSLEARFIVSAS